MAQFQNTSSKTVRTSDTTSALMYMTEGETAMPRRDTGATYRTSDSYNTVTTPSEDPYYKKMHPTYMTEINTVIPGDTVDTYRTYDSNNTTTINTKGQYYAQMYPPQYVDPKYLPSEVTASTAANPGIAATTLGRHGPKARRSGNVKATLQLSKAKKHETSHFNDPMCCAADIKVVIYSLNTCLTCVVIMSFVIIVAFHDIIGIAAGGAGFYVTLKFLLYTGCTFATHRRGWKLLLLTVILIMGFMLVDVILTVVAATNVMALDNGKYKMVEGIKAVVSSLAWALGISFVSAHFSLVCACIKFIRHLRKHGRGKLSADDDFWHAIID